MDAFNIGKQKNHMKHEPIVGFQDINGLRSGNFSSLGQEGYRTGLFQVRDMFWYTLHESFY